MVKIFLSPEESMKIQLGLNSDIVMIMDECPKKSNNFDLIKTLWNYHYIGLNDLK